MYSDRITASNSEDERADPAERRTRPCDAKPGEALSIGPASVLPYHDHLDELAGEMLQHGTLGVIVIDLSALTALEYKHGGAVYEGVRRRAIDVIADQAGRMFRNTDTLALDEPDGIRLLLFMKPKRKWGVGLSPSDLQVLTDRLLKSLSPRIARLGFPYTNGSLRMETGYSLAIHNPLLNSERIIRRAIVDALECATHRRSGERLRTKQRLQEIISQGRIVTRYQPILRMDNESLLGYEALSKGVNGTGLELADELFAAAREHGLDGELDRLCRTKALEHSRRVPKEAKVFVNTLPGTVNDPEFRGHHLIHSLEAVGLEPERIVLEITEKLVIENYNLFSETMSYYTDLGMRFAVDDLGAGYSGLEAVARLKPAYLKVDTGLVRDIHTSRVHQEMIKAILFLGKAINATVIAEGIQTDEEKETLQRLGVEYGQGYFLARPVLASE